MRVHVYLRISADRTGEELGVTRQREDCLRLATQRGWDVTAVHQDNDTSAAGKVRRPGFERLLNAIEAGEADAIAAWSLDRLTRNRRDTLRLIEAAQARAVTIALVRGSDMDMSTPAGRLSADVLAGVARHEIDQKSDRQIRAARQAAELGRPPSGPVPFGFLPDRVSHDPVQAAAIREAYTAVLAGASLSSVARRWNAAGLVSGRVRTGKVNRGQSEWQPETVKRLLVNPRNAGLRAYRGEIVSELEGEPIVPLETWSAVRAILTDPARLHQGAQPRRLLSGLAVCGVCGAPVFAGARRSELAAYRCAQAAHVARRGDHADAFIGGGVIEGTRVRGVVVERLSRPDAVDLLPREDVANTRELSAQVRLLRGRIEATAMEFADDDTVTPAQVRTIMSRLRARLAQAEAELAAAGRTSVLAPLVTADDVGAAWASLDIERRRPVVDALMTIRLHPVGRGARRFDPATIEVRPRRPQEWPK